MKLPLALLPVVAGLANAQYFSAGWTPGQPTPTQSPQATPGRRGTIPPKPSFLDSLMAGGPLSALSSAIGFNTTSAPSVVWDERISLITDSKYTDLIVNEQMTPEEEEKRLWFIIVTSTAGQPEGLSRLVDEAFDATYNYTQEKGDLEHVRFGRIDYLDVTVITTKWALWSPPTLVVLKDRGRTLRFYRVGQIRLSDEVLYQFLKEEGWRRKEPWKSVYGPGGDREWVLDYIALALAAVYGCIVRVPKWLMYMISGGLATILINFLHKPTVKDPSKANAGAAPGQAATAPTPVAAKADATTTATSGPRAANKRRSKK